jgi:hypothetical protein
VGLEVDGILSFFFWRKSGIVESPNGGIVVVFVFVGEFLDDIGGSGEPESEPVVGV